jgi:cytidylate kinase
MIVTIDGPAGSGKSSTARAVARRLGFRHLDSGAFYRAVTYAALESGIPPSHWPELTTDALSGFRISARPAEDGFRLFRGDDDITERIRSPEVNAHVSLMARVPAVRHWLLDRLRNAAQTTDLVADGRDMGTVVFPQAEVKVFLVADPAVRARRRLAEQGHAHPDASLITDESRRLQERDRIDSERATAPLRRAPDAVDIDTTRLAFDEQVERVVQLVRDRRHSG